MVRKFFGLKRSQALGNQPNNVSSKNKQFRRTEYLENWFECENGVFLSFKLLNLKGLIPDLSELISIAWNFKKPMAVTLKKNYVY